MNRPLENSTTPPGVVMLEYGLIQMTEVSQFDESSSPRTDVSGELDILRLHSLFLKKMHDIQICFQQVNIPTFLSVNFKPNEF